MKAVLMVSMDRDVAAAPHSSCAVKSGQIQPGDLAVCVQHANHALCCGAGPVFWPGTGNVDVHTWVMWHAKYWEM
jgi:hypothetical protein